MYRQLPHQTNLVESKHGPQSTVIVQLPEDFEACIAKMKLKANKPDILSKNKHNFLNFKFNFSNYIHFYIFFLHVLK